ncbi:MAG: glutamate 5-kinase, partial [Hungatella sp.]
QNASLIPLVLEITPQLLSMGKATSGSNVGTGGMAAKLAAAQIATDSGADMVIASGDHVEIIDQILRGEDCGTLFAAHHNLDFDLMDYINYEYEGESK